MAKVAIQAEPPSRPSLHADPDLGFLPDKLMAARHDVSVATVRRVRAALRIASPYRRAVAGCRLVQAFVETLTPPPPTASCLTYWAPEDE